MNYLKTEFSPVKGEKGFILLVSYLLLAALSVFSLAVFQRGTGFLKSAERNKKKIVAFNMAESGFDKAYYDVKNAVITSFPHTGSYASMNSGSVQGGYTTTVTDMGSGIKKVEITGYSPAQSSTTESVESRSLVGYVQTGTSSAFNYGVFAKDSITLNGNPDIDSYNSNDGAYGGDNVGDNGNIGTDSTAANTVQLIGNAIVHGTAYTGPGSDPDTVISITGASADITGVPEPAPSAFNPSAASTAVASSGALSISGNTTVTLSAGTYNYTSISISGNGRLVATGAVEIYVSGAISIAGNGISTASSEPPNMLIYSTGSSSVSISGNGNLYAGIYAPNSAVSNSGNGEVFGAIVADTYTQSGNGDVHFDEALEEVDGGETSMSVLSWYETGLTNQG